uniref:Uncharacterized protein n=1 Tax=Anguilla anguilla TaxID=7936 RepID=A0A0E9X297_ANGAN
MLSRHSYRLSRHGYALSTASKAQDKINPKNKVRARSTPMFRLTFALCIQIAMTKYSYTQQKSHYCTKLLILHMVAFFFCCFVFHNIPPYTPF